MKTDEELLESIEAVTLMLAAAGRDILDGRAGCYLESFDKLRIAHTRLTALVGDFCAVRDYADPQVAP